MTSPALRRIRRIRWTATVVFAATSALCLSALVVIALRIDITSRTAALEQTLEQQASTLAELAVPGDDGSLDLSRFGATEAARTTPVIGVFTDESIVYASPDQDALPPDDRLVSLLESQRDRPEVVSFVGPQAAGPTLHWAAAPVLVGVPSGVTAQAVVVVGSPVPGAHEHALLRTRLVATAAGLVALAAALGHVISRFAMRPALRGLAEQERFLVEAAHELRTPLSVLGLVLDPGRTHADLDSAQQAIGRARRQVERLTGITTALLVRARASSGQTAVSFDRLRLDQLVETVVAEIPEADGVEVVVSPVVVAGNPDLLGQAVRNLVENALRHGRAPVTVTVDDSGVEVVDHGAGIPPSRRRRAVRPGVTGGDGTGTGLAIVVWVAELHGAGLVLDDAPHGGLRARLTVGASAGRERPSHRLLMKRREDSQA